jgi:hypothetical protein
MSSLPVRIAYTLLGSVLVTIGSCGRGPPPAPLGTPAAQSAGKTDASAGRDTMSEAERRFGVSPTLNKDVTYQPDVIIMEHGAEAIRSQGTDGVTWTIDANAPGASSVQVDKILFATGRAVGRVLAVERKGDDLAVTLGPVELTDVYEELHVSYHGAIDPSKMITYYAPDFPGTYNDLDEPTEQSSRRAQGAPGMRFAALSATGDILSTGGLSGANDGPLRSAVWTEADRAQFRALSVSNPAVGTGNPVTDINVNDYHFSPNCCGGLGVVITYDKGGLKFTAAAVMTLKNPHIDLTLDILHGLKNAYIEVSGVGGFTVSIHGGNSGDVKNLNAVIMLPVDFALPISGIGTPFSVVFRQGIRVTTVLTGKGAALDAEGEYQYGGTVRAGIRNGQLIADAPTMGATVKDLAETLRGNSMGVNALILGYGAKIIVGIGSFGFVVGPYIGLDSTIGTTKGSDLQAAIGYVCRSADVNLWLDFGVGYALPNAVVKALNTFLDLFHAKGISATHGTSLGTKAIYEGSKAIPPACGKS